MYNLISENDGNESWAKVYDVIDPVITFLIKQKLFSIQS